MRYSIMILGVLGVAGCAQVERVFAPRAEPVPEVVAPMTPDDLDVTTPAERKAARVEAATARAGALGPTVASLGSPAEPGLWLKTPLVDAPARGRVDYAVTGQSVAVDLIPLDAVPGSGSQLSLAGFRAVGAPLTALPELQVYQLAD
jgi:hypothetical protein